MRDCSLRSGCGEDAEDLGGSGAQKRDILSSVESYLLEPFNSGKQRGTLRADDYGIAAKRKRQSRVSHGSPQLNGRDCLPV